MLEETVVVTCPHCWEEITLDLDLMVRKQAFVDDCPVCCAPMMIRYAVEDGVLTNLNVERENG